MRPTICVDPGHGGRARGAVCGEHAEADWNLRAAEALVQTLHSAGWPVVLTRSHDEEIRISERLSVAALAHAGALISLHHNAWTDPLVGGAEIFRGDDLADHALATAIWDEMVPQLHERGIRNRGIKPQGESAHGQLGILRASMPAVLVELAFLTNAADRGQCLYSGWHYAAAQAIRDGLERFVRGE